MIANLCDAEREGLRPADYRLGELRRTLERFRAHDENLFEQTWQDRGDEDKLAAAANRGRQELERLFEEDAKVRRSA